MLDENDVLEAVSLHLLEKGYYIVEKPAGGEVDIIAREPQSKARLLVSATRISPLSGSKGKPQSSWTESQIFQALASSIAKVLMIRHTAELGPDDQIALAFPDLPTVRKYVNTEKCIMDCLNLRFFLVSPEKNVLVI